MDRPFLLMSREYQKLGDLPLGSRLLYRAKSEWRSAAIARFGEEKATLTICSPSGRTYRLSRQLEAEIIFIDNLPVLRSDYPDEWIENYTTYDQRW